MSTQPDPASQGDLEAARDFAIAISDEAAQVAVAQFGGVVARRKHDGSLVTRADEQIDRLLADRIRARYPDDAILSEEQATIYDPLLRRTWVIDPIDGTTNFARGLLVWGVSIALLVDGVPVAGVVRFPMMNELFVATLGGGATRNGETIHSADNEFLDDSHLFMECTRTRRRYVVNLPLKSRMMGSAAYHLCKVADGSVLGGSEATPMVWDIAAAGLILSEAGGHMRSADGRAIFPLAAQRMDYRSQAWPILYAANEGLLRLVLAGVRPYEHSLPRPTTLS
jgi:myo-inositol-1(or 4)-monophosphatase